VPLGLMGEEVGRCRSSRSNRTGSVLPLAAQLLRPTPRTLTDWCQVMAGTCQSESGHGRAASAIRRFKSQRPIKYDEYESSKKGRLEEALVDYRRLVAVVQAMFGDVVKMQLDPRVAPSFDEAFEVVVRRVETAPVPSIEEEKASVKVVQPESPALDEAADVIVKQVR
jgi:hypothetical protein